MSQLPRTIVLGSTGQVGSSLMQRLGERGIGISREEADITDKAALRGSLDRHGPVAALINASAYNDVERAEGERELAFAVNADAPGWASSWAAERNIPFVHFSTEYVFPDGNNRRWREDDATDPLNTYGQSKRAGELAVRAAYPESVIIRTSWVFSERQNNFVHKVLHLARTQPSLTVVSDQVGCPTFAPDLAAAALRITQDAGLRSRIRGGLLHLAGGNPVSRSDFARAIIQVGVDEGVLGQMVPVVETTSDRFVTAARRPLHCILDTSQAEALGIELNRWDASLPRAVRAARR